MEVAPPSDSTLYYVVNKTRRVPNKVIRHGNEDERQEHYISTGKSEDQITSEEVIFLNTNDVCKKTVISEIKQGISNEVFGKDKDSIMVAQLEHELNKFMTPSTRYRKFHFYQLQIWILITSGYQYKFLHRWRLNSLIDHQKTTLDRLFGEEKDSIYPKESKAGSDLKFWTISYQRRKLARHTTSVNQQLQEYWKIVILQSRIRENQQD